MRPRPPNILAATGKGFSSGYDLGEMVFKDSNDYRRTFDVART